MYNTKAFCENCREEVDVNIIKENLTGNIKNEEYLYVGNSASCANCGAEIYVAEINDSNLSALYDVYREKHNIISLDMILSIPTKYAIGKRPFSLLLGWGEQTFSRYCDGDMPTKHYSDMLRRIYNEPTYYAKILENNKDNLKPAAYKKSKLAVQELLGNNAKTKMDYTVKYLLNQCEDVTPLALQKALYYVQGFYYAFYEQFIFTEDCEAWVHGPVYRDIYSRYRDYKFDAIKATDEFDDAVFSTSEKAIIDNVIKNICCYSGKVLELFTHSEEPWLSARGDLPATTSSAEIIDKMKIGDYFKTIKHKHNMINPNDIKSYSQNMFEHI